MAQVICPKHGAEWMDEEYYNEFPVGGYCVACGEIIDEEELPQQQEQAPATNPFHAVNNPLPAQFLEEEEVELPLAIHLTFFASQFTYKDQLASQEVKGEVKSSDREAFVEKARKNAMRQKCQFYVVDGYHVVISEDYTE